jgi:His-Xaa-Ser system radical SAM maturase HxsC
MRRIAATLSPDMPHRPHRVVDLVTLAGQWQPDLHFAAIANDAVDRADVQRMSAAGASNVQWVASQDLEAGDILVPLSNHDRVEVLFRESDSHHALLTTNRCNSLCVMCSQPPTAQADGWRVEQAIEVVRHIRRSPPALGLSGGEPLLLEGELRRLIDVIATLHPGTRIELLTNARLLANSAVAGSILDGLDQKIGWLVPLYGHADFLHDFVVQSPGAFDETIEGLLVLRKHEQAVQLRLVLIDPVLRIFPALCAFIGRNLPFVREVALMACEPIGFALANQALCEVDLGDWSETLLSAGRQLERHRVPYLFMNTPLCALPRALWPMARKSISDWKNVYAEECEECSEKADCAGLFAWHENGWKPTRLRAIRRESP